MDDPHDGSYAREPQLDDLARLARALNEHDAYGSGLGLFSNPAIERLVGLDHVFHLG